MAKLVQGRFEIRRYDRLVFDDQDVGGADLVDLRLGFGDQGFDVAHVRAQDQRHLLEGEAFEGGEQERFSRTRGHAHQLFPRLFGSGGRSPFAGFELRAGTQPDGVDHMIEGHARRHFRVPGQAVRRQGLKSHAHIVVAGDLVAGQGAGVAPHIGQMM